MARSYTLVYLEGGTRTHLLDDLLSPNEPNSVLCGRTPFWPSLWLGTGTQDEYERAETLPVCAGCTREAERG